MSVASWLQQRWYARRGAPWLLLPLEGLFRCVARARRAMIQPEALPLPVFAIGNLSVGGTGKTPVVIWAAQTLQQAGHRVGVISRGYGGQAEHWPQTVRADSDPALVGDEPVLIAQRTGCPIVVGPDRVAAARQLLAEHDVDVLLSDDGLQHYRLPREREVVVVDGERGFGNGHCLPAGPLREPQARLHEIDMLIVNGGGFRLPTDAGQPFATLMLLQPGDAVNLVTGERQSLDAFSSVHALAGIGNPERFFKQLENLGMTVDRRPLPDHHPLTVDDLAFADENPVLMTEKDAVKVRAFAHNRCWFVPVDAVIPDDAANKLKEWLR